MKEDNRVFKTKRDLKNALVSLLKSQSFDKLTVIDICNEACVNRITFYNHYKDKYELFDDALGDVINAVIARSAVGLSDMDEPDILHNLTTFCDNLIGAVVDECCAYKDILAALSRQENSILGFILNETVRKKLKLLVDKAAEIRPLKFPDEIVVSMLLGGIGTVIVDWLIRGVADVDKEKLTSMLREVIRNFIESDIIFR